MKPIKVAVIGRTGRGNYGHGLDVVWKRIPGVEIVAVADPDEKGRAAAAKRLGVANAYADFRKMLEKERPGIVSVADRHVDLHRDMVVACAQAGASMFLEKPMARTLAEADEMVRACETHHVKLAIAHQTRYSPRVARVREMLADGRLGDLLEVRARGKEDRRGGGEDLMVLGTHMFDLMRHLAGDPRWCFAQIWQGGKPAALDQQVAGGEGIGPMLGDQISASYGLPRGVTGFFGTHRARHGAGQRYGLTLYGSKGIVTIGMGSMPPVWWCDDPSWNPGQSRARWEAVTSAGPGKPETNQDASLDAGNVWIVQDLLDAIAKDRQPLSSVYDGRAALEMILAVYESHRQGMPVALPLKNREHPLKKSG